MALGVNSVKQYSPLLESDAHDLLKRLLQNPADYVDNLKRCVVSLRIIYLLVLTCSGRCYARYAGGLTLSAIYGYQVRSNEDEMLRLADECVNILSNDIASGGGIWPVDIFPARQFISLGTSECCADTPMFQCKVCRTGRPAQASSAKRPYGSPRWKNSSRNRTPTLRNGW